MNVNELIKNLQDGDNVSANRQFNTVMADKMTAALDAKKIEIASGMIQRKTSEEEVSAVAEEQTTEEE
jgi:hypothetical protein|tara:strand:- start:267 stop:470 length:204 start_codon:yes stop_codon:yes gene_type:complete